MAGNYQNQEFSETIATSSLITEVMTLQPTYPLTEVDYMHLLSGPGWPFKVAFNLFMALVGYALSLVPKIPATFKRDPVAGLQDWELYTVGAVALICLLCALVGLRVRPKRVAIKSKIEKCFARETSGLYARGK